jgi:hypothetical protein
LIAVCAYCGAGAGSNLFKHTGVQVFDGVVASIYSSFHILYLLEKDILAGHFGFFLKE